MANSTKKTPGRKPVKSAPRKKAPAKEPEVQQEQQPVMVEAMQPQAFQMAIELIDNANVRGADAGNILALKNELARVAGMSRQPAG